MNAIVLAFTLKGQDFRKIAEAMRYINSQLEENTILIHGFMPREDVIKKRFDTEVVDTIESTFPIRLNLYNGGPLRNEMVEIACKLNAKVYVIGEIKEGVLEEVDLYKDAGLTIVGVSRFSCAL